MPQMRENGGVEVHQWGAKGKHSCQGSKKKLLRLQIRITVNAQTDHKAT